MTGDRGYDYFLRKVGKLVFGNLSKEEAGALENELMITSEKHDDYTLTGGGSIPGDYQPQTLQNKTEGGI